MVLGRGKILIPGFSQSPLKLVDYDVAHSFSLGDVGRDFPFTEDETRRHFSYLSGAFREPIGITEIEVTRLMRTGCIQRINENEIIKRIMNSKVEERRIITRC